MVIGHAMSFQSKKKELKKLIEYGEENNFNPELLEDYKAQLSHVETKLKEQSEERERFNKSTGESNG